MVCCVLMLCDCSLIAMLSMCSPLHFFSIDFLFLLKVFLKVCQSTLIFVIGGIDRKDLLSHSLAEVSRLKSYTIERAVFIQLETKSKEVYKLRFVWDALCCFHCIIMIKNKQFGQTGWWMWGSLLRSARSRAQKGSKSDFSSCFPIQNKIFFLRSLNIFDLARYDLVNRIWFSFFAFGCKALPVFAVRYSIQQAGGGSECGSDRSLPNSLRLLWF